MGYMQLKFKTFTVAVTEGRGSRKSSKGSDPKSRVFCDKTDGVSTQVVWLKHGTYRRSAFLGIPFGTVFRPRPWQSTCDPEQLHLCGHPSTDAAHASRATTRAQTQQTAARFSGPVKGIISTLITSNRSSLKIRGGESKRCGRTGPKSVREMMIDFIRFGTSSPSFLSRDSISRSPLKTFFPLKKVRNLGFWLWHVGSVLLKHVNVGHPAQCVKVFPNSRHSLTFR